MQRLTSQNARFHGLINKLGMDADDKKALVKEVSAGRCSSSKDLSAHEMQTAISILTGNYDSRIARMQAKARAIADDIGLLKVVDKKMDYAALNAFILRTFKKKSLFDLEYNELRDCITALERWRGGRMKKELTTV